MKTSIFFLCTGNSCRSQMADAGVDISKQYSKTTDELAGREFDYVVTACAYADENCPFFPAKTRIVHYGFDDPLNLARKAATVEEALQHFRRVRDEIRAFVRKLPESIVSG